jgi:hypothetical protein
MWRKDCRVLKRCTVSRRSGHVASTGETVDSHRILVDKSLLERPSRRLMDTVKVKITAFRDTAPCSLVVHQYPRRL